MEIQLEAILRARDGRLNDLSGLIAQLWDEDLASDDLLAEGLVAGKGTLFHTVFRFDPKKVASADSVGEKCPDLYVVVKNGQGALLFRSAVLRNIVLDTTKASAKAFGLEFVEA